jgi:hypothetical protein
VISPCSWKPEKRRRKKKKKYKRRKMRRNQEVKREGKPSALGKQWRREENKRLRGNPYDIWIMQF